MLPDPASRINVLKPQMICYSDITMLSTQDNTHLIYMCTQQCVLLETRGVGRGERVGIKAVIDIEYLVLSCIYVCVRSHVSMHAHKSIRTYVPSYLTK